MNSNKWAVIINLKSGKKNFRVQVSYIKRKLEKAGLIYEVRITQFADHATLIARNMARQGFENFLVVGGDGTVSEVINGIFSSGIDNNKHIKLALIPRGTGNDWARFWGLTANYKHSVKVFLEGRTRNIDIGQVKFMLEGEEQKRYFINSVGFGLDAAVAHHTNRLKRFVGSHAFLYMIALLAAVFRYKSRPAVIRSVEKDIEDELFTMNVANGCFSGGGMKQNPHALPWDGLLDVMMARRPSFRDITTALPRVFNGTILEHPVIESFRTDQLFLHSQNGGYFEADGIVVHYAPPVDIHILPSAIQMIVPET